MVIGSLGEPVDSSALRPQNPLFFGWEGARRRKRDIHPADAIVGAGRVGRGLAKGGVFGRGCEDGFLTASAIYYNAEEERDKKIIFISYF